MSKAYAIGAPGPLFQVSDILVSLVLRYYLPNNAVLQSQKFSLIFSIASNLDPMPSILLFFGTTTSIDVATIG